MVQACANVGARKTGQNGRSNASGIIVVTDAPSAPVGIVVIVSWWQKAVQAPTTPASPSAMVDQTVATAPDACTSRISQPLTTVATHYCFPQLRRERRWPESLAPLAKGGVVRAPKVGWGSASGQLAADVLNALVSLSVR